MNKLISIIKKLPSTFRELFKIIKTQNFQAVITILSLIIGLIGTVITIKSLKSYFVNVDEIAVGIGPFQTGKIERLELQYINMFREINDYMRRQNSRFRFYPVVSKSDYAHLFTDLQDKGTLNISSVSPFNYLLFKHGKTDYDTNQFILLGYKYLDHKMTYRSRMIWRKDLNISYDTLLFRIKNNKYSSLPRDSSIYILTKEERSTSGHVIPEIFLTENGICLKKIPHISLNRPQMVDSLKANKNLIIGFISNDDFNDQLEQKEKELFDYYEIDIPLPYDVFLTNKKWWNKLSKRSQNQIRRGLQSSGYGILKRSTNNDALFKYDIFSLFIGSGILFINSCHDQAKDTLVIIPDQQSDIFDLRRKFEENDTVDIIEFQANNINAMYSTLDTVFIGRTTVKKFSDNVYTLNVTPDLRSYLDTNENNVNTHIHIHILPSKFSLYETDTEQIKLEIRQTIASIIFWEMICQFPV